MLVWAAWLLTVAVVAGLGLIVLSQVAASYVRLRWPGVMHGVLGLAGFALLLAGLGGPVRGTEQGAGSFGLVAAGFVGVAALLGLLVLASRMRRRPPSMLILGVHASLAVGGLVMLAAYLSA